MDAPRTRTPRSLAWLAFLGPLFVACSPAAPSSPAVAPVSGDLADRAVAVALHCVAGEPWVGAHMGFGLVTGQATAHRPPGDGEHVLVRIPEGVYTGRLPPPRPAGELWLQVDVNDRTCREVSGP